uniref:Tyrosine-protein kinase receptor n=1 Tax=Paramormyrops kingsleyae TaxID=1676925 RepID=A0A3B3QJ29_9TELE
MSTGAFCLFVLSAAFLAGLQCASQKSSMGIGVTLPSTALAGSGEASGKKDANQTHTSRRKRKNLSVDFAVPSLLRNYLSEFIKRPLNGDCQHADGCYAVRANLRMQCVPLQKTVSSLLETKLSAADSPDNVSAAGQLPYRNKRPLSRVLNFALTKDSRKSNQVVIEIGEESVRTGCGGLSVDGDPPQATLEIDLTRILEWWLGAGGGRLRVRLIPERRAQVPGREEKYSAAIRAADPRLFLQIASRGTPQAAHGTGVPRGYWNFTWTAEDELSFPEETAEAESRCHGNGRQACGWPPGDGPDFSWSVLPAGDLWESERTGRVRRTWDEGQFLSVNGSVLGGPWVTSPWLRGGRWRCSLDMSIFLHPQQSGRYTVWLIERDKKPSVLLTTDTPRSPGWVILRLTVGARMDPFRISSGYSQPSDAGTAAFDPDFTTNCTLASSPTPNITLQGWYRCHQGPLIAMGRMCDFRMDCPHGDDEGHMCSHFISGSYCSFEAGDCGWQSVSPRGPSWKLQASEPGAPATSCQPRGTVMAARGGQSKGQQGAALLRSPLFPPPLRNSLCVVRFWMCSGGLHRGALSVWVVENGTGPDIRRSLWDSAAEAHAGPGGRLVVIPLYGLADWFWLQFSAEELSGPGSVLCLDNISLSLDCFLASNGEFPPVVPMVNITPSATGDLPSTTLIPPPSDAKWTFHTCGATGPVGPTPTQCSNSYRNTNINITVGTKGMLKGMQMWKVPETGTYRITGYGAAGGRSVVTTARSHGVYVTADFHLQQDQLLYILVGQQGEDACPNSNHTLNRVCLEQTLPIDSKTRAKLPGGGGGGGGGGATYIFKMKKGVPVPLLIAAGGGGRGYSSQSESQEELLDIDPSVFGLNGRSGAAGGGGGWNDSMPVATQGGRPLLLGGQGGTSCRFGWQTRGGFGGGGGACSSGGGGGGYRGGGTAQDDNPSHDGKDGSSFVSPIGETFIEPLKGIEGHGEVVISPVLNCSHCETGDCHESGDDVVCFCEEDLELAADGVSCVNTTDNSVLHPQLALGLSVGTSALIAALLLAVSGVMIMYRRKHTELQSIQLELQSPDCKLSKLRASTIMTDYNPNYCFAGKTASVNDLKEIPRRNISLTRGLGHGAFGEVYEGLAVGIPGEPSPMQVAVKTLPEVCSEQDELDFLMEALIISKFNHQNIVCCIGVSLQALPRFILLELMAGGDLKSFLRETRPRVDQPSSLNMVDLLNVARDIARGCQYLEENQFIHRDIAARNCLLTCKGPGRVAKIGDFGMARDIYRASYYRKGGRAMLPVKWMPPEAFMEGIFTSKTDTWSFGVLLWEIFSLGYMPYPSRSNQEVLEFVTNGGRMDPPKNCPGPVYRIMTQSWQHQPEDRPNFSTILERIDYCLQDPDVVSVPLPVEYGPLPEEEERVPMRPEDPTTPSLLVCVPGQETAPTGECKMEADVPLQPSQAPQCPQPAGGPELPPALGAAPPPPCYPHLQVPQVPAAAAKPVSAAAQPAAEGGHVNLGFTQGQPPDKEGRNGKPTNLWNPTYGSWFLQQQQRRQQRQVVGRALGEGQEHGGRTVGEAAGLQLQHKQLLQQQQHQGLCRPLLPPPPPPAPMAAPLLLDSASLPPVPLFRLRRFPCGNIGYGYQEQGLPMEPLAAQAAPPPPPPPPPAPASQRPVSMARLGVPEDSRPLLVTMGTATLQDPRLPKMEGHNATVL